MGIERLWLIGALATAYIVTAGSATLTGDTWWAMRMGAELLQHGLAANTTVLAHAPAQGVVGNGQWLAQILLYLTYVGGGELALRTLTGLSLVLGVALTYLAGRRTGAGVRMASLAALLTVLLASSNGSVRSQSLCFVLFGALLYILESRHVHSRLVWAILPLVVLWANLHGSFLLAPVVVGLTAVGDAVPAMRGRRREALGPVLCLGSVALLAAVAAMLNPSGIRVYAYVLQVVGDPVVRMVTEWQPTSWSEPTGKAMAVSVGCLVLVMLGSRRWPRWPDVFVLGALGLLALSAQRNVVWWGFALAPVLARHAQLAIGSRVRPSSRLADRPRRTTQNVALAACLVLVAAFSPIWRPALADGITGQDSSLEFSPRAAVDVIAELPAGRRLFHHQPWAGYLAWRLWPRHLPFVDVRIEAHSLAVWTDWDTINRGAPGWESLLREYQVDALLLSLDRQPDLVRQVRQSAEWEDRFMADGAVLYVRR